MCTIYAFLYSLRSSVNRDKKSTVILVLVLGRGGGRGEEEGGG